MEESILRKLQSLQSTAQRGTLNESANARRLYELLIEKYDVDESELSERKQRKLDCPYGMQVYAQHVCAFLGLGVYSYTFRKKSPLLVESTEQEFALLKDLLRQVEVVFKWQKKEAKIRIDSYLHGFVSAAYPVVDKDPLCPKCEAVLSYSEKGKRYTCTCGYVGKRLKIRQISREDMMAGKMSSGRMLESPAQKA